MASVQCPNCKAYSESSNFCIHCGFPFGKQQHSDLKSLLQEDEDLINKQGSILVSGNPTQSAAMKASADSVSEQDAQTCPVEMSEQYDAPYYNQSRDVKRKAILNLMLISTFFISTINIAYWLFYSAMEDQGVRFRILFHLEASTDIFILYLVFTSLLSITLAGFAFISFVKSHKKTAILLSSILCLYQVFYFAEFLFNASEMSFSFTEYLAQSWLILPTLLLLFFMIKSTPGQESNRWLPIYIILELAYILIRFVLTPANSVVRNLVDMSLVILIPAVIVENIIHVSILIVGFMPTRWFKPSESSRKSNTVLIFQILATWCAICAFVCQIIGVLTIKKTGVQWLYYKNQITQSHNFEEKYGDVISTHQLCNTISVCCTVLFAVFAIIAIIALLAKTKRPAEEAKNQIA